MNTITIVFHTRPDFDVIETADATLFAPFVGKKVKPPHGEASQTNSHWKLVHWFLRKKLSLEKLVNWLLYNTFCIENNSQTDHKLAINMLYASNLIRSRTPKGSK